MAEWKTDTQSAAAIAPEFFYPYPAFIAVGSKQITKTAPPAGFAMRLLQVSLSILYIRLFARRQSERVGILRSHLRGGHLQTGQGDKLILNK